MRRAFRCIGSAFSVVSGHIAPTMKCSPNLKLNSHNSARTTTEPEFRSNEVSTFNETKILGSNKADYIKAGVGARLWNSLDNSITFNTSAISGSQPSNHLSTKSHRKDGGRNGTSPNSLRESQCRRAATDSGAAERPSTRSIYRLGDPLQPSSRGELPQYLCMALP